MYSSVVLAFIYWNYSNGVIYKPYYEQSWSKYPGLQIQTPFYFLYIYTLQIPLLLQLLGQGI